MLEFARVAGRARAASEEQLGDRVTKAVAEHLRRLPKVELHCHLEGSSRATTIRELAAKNGVAFPVEDPAHLYTFTSLNQFLEIYDVVCRSLVTPDDFRRITYEALEDGVRAGVRYREMFFSPGFPIRLGVPVKTVWEGIRTGLLEARADLDIQARMILDFDKPSGAGHAMEMAEFAGSEPDRDLLIGVGADSVERDIDHRIFAPAFEEAGRHGLRRTMHAGEDGPADNIRIAIEECGCERIDHGFRLLDDPELTDRVVARQIPVTVCPTSNVVIANVVPDVASHPFARERERGVLATLNSDDPGMMRFDVADEYVAVAEAFGYELEDMEEISLAGIESCWASQDEKRALRRRFHREFDELRSEYGVPARGRAEPTG
jgi:adenosine deaminase